MKQMSSNLWDDYWKDRDNREWWKTPAPEVLDLIRSLSPIERPNMLDLGCGPGRHAIAFALAGFRVTAADASQSAISHLDEWAEELKLSIQTQVCDVLGSKLPSGSFDVVVSYNVIYHGLREQFARAIERVHQLLRLKGIFYFTCPTRQDGKYGFGEEVAPHTFRCTKSITPGDIHYFADKKDLQELLTDFRVLSCSKNEGYWNNEGERQFYSNCHVCVEKL